MKKEYVLINAVPYFKGDDHFVLLVMKDRPDWQRGFFNLVGGKVEDGETTDQAAIRELEEETGYKPLNDIKKIGTVECANEGEIVHCYEATVDTYIQREPKPREGETEVVRWYPWLIVRNDSRLIPSLRVILPLMLTGVHNWRLYVCNTFTEKDYVVKLQIPSYLGDCFKENKSITKILTKGSLDSPFEYVLDNYCSER